MTIDKLPPGPPVDDDPPHIALRLVDDGDGPSLPPHDTTAEQCVLGAMLLSQDVAAEASQLLDVGDFYEPKHQTVYDAITTLLERNQPADPVTVASILLDSKELPRIGGPAYLHTLIATVPTVANYQHYARIVITRSKQRALVDISTRLAQRARSGADPDRLTAGVFDTLTELETAGLRADGPVTGLADLDFVLSGQMPVIDPPTYGIRSDGHALFYAARVNGIYGDPESAKTWLAYLVIVDALKKGQRCAIIDVDHNGPILTAEHLLRLGAQPKDLADHNRFRYYQPDDGHELRAAVAQLVDWAPKVAVLDSIGEILPMLGVKSVDNDEITMALRSIAAPLADAGACVITIDHLPKSTEARETGYAIGGTAKKRAIDGSYLQVEVKSQPAPGQIGKCIIRVIKDRPGKLREQCPGKYAGSFVIDSTQNHITVASIQMESAPVDAEGNFRPTVLMERVSRFLEAHPMASQTKIEEGISGNAKHIRAAVETLIREGYVTTATGQRNAKIHHLVAHYRQEEDPDHAPRPAPRPDPVLDLGIGPRE